MDCPLLGPAGLDPFEGAAPDSSVVGYIRRMRTLLSHNLVDLVRHSADRPWMRRTSFSILHAGGGSRTASEAPITGGPCCVTSVAAVGGIVPCLMHTTGFVLLCKISSLIN